MAVSKDTNELILRLAERFKPLREKSPELKDAFDRIGMLVSARAKMNVRRYGMIMTSDLITSLRHEVYETAQGIGVKVGSFRVPYAAIHEFGGPFTDRMRRAMFANLRNLGKLGNRQNKNVIQNGRIIARPYLRPALQASRPFILDELRKALKL